MQRFEAIFKKFGTAFFEVKVRLRLNFDLKRTLTLKFIYFEKDTKFEKKIPIGFDGTTYLMSKRNTYLHNFDFKKWKI